MRRVDREVTDFQEIVDILERSDTIRLGLAGKEYPYVVPLSFGYEVEDGKIVIYVHGAKQGLKHDLIAGESRCCVEADIFYRYAETKHGITTEYESVIGFGEIEAISGADARKGLDLILAHAGFAGYGYGDEALSVTTVYRIRLESVTGKRNRG